MFGTCLESKQSEKVVFIWNSQVGYQLYIGIREMLSDGFWYSRSLLEMAKKLINACMIPLYFKFEK